MSGYWWSLQEDKTGHRFRENATFEQAVKLYKFDRELRQVCAHALERIEVSVRTKLKYYPSIEFTPWWFEDQTLFRNPAHYRSNLKHIEDEVNRSKEDFIEHHRQKYAGDQRLPPAWKTLEVISFGTLSKLYKSLSKGAAAKTIARELGLPNQKYLASWLQVFTILRNVCAHHSRFWNRLLRKPPKVFRPGSKDWMEYPSHDPKRMYISICCMVYALRHITDDDSVELDLKQLFEDYGEDVMPTAVGFPLNWREDPFWANR